MALYKSVYYYYCYYEASCVYIGLHACTFFAEYNLHIAVTVYIRLSYAKIQLQCNVPRKIIKTDEMSYRIGGHEFCLQRSPDPL